MATLVSKPCPSADHPEDAPRVITIVCSSEQHNAYMRGSDLIQRIFPDMPIDDRERFVTGYCGPCWDAMFPADEDEDPGPDWHPEAPGAHLPEDAGFQESQ